MENKVDKFCNWRDHRNDVKHSSDLIQCPKCKTTFCNIHSGHIKKNYGKCIYCIFPNEKQLEKGKRCKFRYRPKNEYDEGEQCDNIVNYNECVCGNLFCDEHNTAMWTFNCIYCISSNFGE